MPASTTALAVVEPITITEAMLVSTDVPEADYTAWSAATAYVIGNRVIRTSNHRIYERLTNGTTATAPEDDTTNWIEVSRTNRWKAFDTSSSTQTLQAGAMTYVLELGQAITTVALHNLTNATQVQIIVDDPDYGEVHNETTSLAPTPEDSTPWEFCFGSRLDQKFHVDFSIPSFPNAEITVIITGGDDLGVGVLVFGRARRLGLGINYGATVGIQDYSRITTDEWGETVITQGNYADTASFEMALENEDLDRLKQVLTALRSTGCLWIGREEYQATVVFGIYKDFKVVIAYESHSDCSIELQGLT